MDSKKKIRLLFLALALGAAALIVITTFQTTEDKGDRVPIREIDATNIESVTLQIPSVDGDCCIRNVAQILSATESVPEMYVNLYTKRFVIYYDADKTTGQEITHLLSTSGYQAQIMD